MCVVTTTCSGLVVWKYVDHMYIRLVFDVVGRIKHELQG